MSVRHFRDLGDLRRADPARRSASATGATSSIAKQAGNWARFWRQEIQWYIQRYHTVTGVDLSADMSDVRAAETAAARNQQPSVHIGRRMARQQRSDDEQGNGRAGQPPAQAEV